MRDRCQALAQSADHIHGIDDRQSRPQDHPKDSEADQHTGDDERGFTPQVVRPDNP